MIKRMGLIRKQPDWSMERFREHWRTHHGALAAQLPGLRHYEQNHIIDSVQRGINYERGTEQLDGFSGLWFDTEEAMQAAVKSDAGRALVPDENHFIGHLRIVSIDEVEVVRPPANDHGTIKRMSLLKRRADVSVEQFRYEWRDVHADLVKTMPGVKGYRQNHVIGRQFPKGTNVDYDGVPIDGIVELWFDNNESLNAAFSSPQGQKTMAHARTFIAEITTFLVETHRVV